MDCPWARRKLPAKVGLPHPSVSDFLETIMRGLIMSMAACKLTGCVGTVRIFVSMLISGTAILAVFLHVLEARATN